MQNIGEIVALLQTQTWQLAPAAFPQLWKSVQVTQPLDQHQKIRHLVQRRKEKNAHTILLKVMTSVLLKNTNTGMNG